MVCGSMWWYVVVCGGGVGGGGGRVGVWVLVLGHAAVG